METKYHRKHLSVSEKTKFPSGTKAIFIKLFRSSSKRYGALALYVPTSYLLQLDNLTKTSNILPVFTSIAFVIGNPELQ